MRTYSLLDSTTSLAMLFRFSILAFASGTILSHVGETISVPLDVSSTDRTNQATAYAIIVS